MAARARIERGWTQSAEARDASGNSVLPDSPLAVCWDVLGALFDAEMPTSSHDALFKELPGRSRRRDVSIVSFNDAEGRTKEEVLALYDRAIAACEVSH